MMNGRQVRETGLIIKCRHCGKEKDESKFSFSRGWGYKTTCRECINERQNDLKNGRGVSTRKKEEPQPERPGTSKTLPYEIIPTEVTAGYKEKIEGIKSIIKPGDVFRVPRKWKEEGTQMVKARVVEIHSHHVLMEYRSGIRESFTNHEMYKILKLDGII